MGPVAVRTLAEQVPPTEKSRCRYDTSGSCAVRLCNVPCDVSEIEWHVDFYKRIVSAS